MSVYEVKTFKDIQDAVFEELKLQTADTASRSKVKRDINMVYIHEVAAFKRWFWLSGTTSIEHKPYYAGGTASVTPDSNLVTLSTAPLTSQEGKYFATDNYAEVYKVVSHIAGSDQLVLNTPYTGVMNNAVSFKMWTDQLILPTDCRETIEVWHDFSKQGLKPVGLQEFRKIVAENPRTQGRPRYYTTYDYVDPSPEDPEFESDRYRVMLLYPSIYDASTTMHIDYVKDIEPLELDTDEPVLPIQDRMVLVYGALSRAWSRERNPEEAARNLQLFQNKLAMMAGKLEDSFEQAQIVPKSRYIAAKRGPRISRFKGTGSLDGGAYTAPSYLKNVTVHGAILTDDMTVSTGVLIDGRDISADGARLDALGAIAENIGTPDRVVITDSSSQLEESEVRSSALYWIKDADGIESVNLDDDVSTPTTVAEWAFASFNKVRVTYSLKRGPGNEEIGIINLVTDGTSAGISNGNIASIGTLGVEFGVTLTATTMRLTYMTTATGVPLQMKYKVEKWLG